MPEYYVGLMSGTSMDGIDAAIVDFSKKQPALIATSNTTWPSDLHSALLATHKLPDDQLNTLSSLDASVGSQFAEAANTVIKSSSINPNEIVAIGSHGQTIRHRPNSNQPFTLQIGNAETIANQTNINVVSDFRTADINAGGQGAPLVPAFHQVVFQSPDVNRVIVNIGGISNITILPKDPTKPITGFDTGPGNGLMDAWVAKHHNLPYDKSGELAATGKTDVRLLANYLMDDYFQLTPPKSTGFELFNLDWINKHLDTNEISENVLSTLCDLTATSIIRAINLHARDTDEIYVCGGGAHNTELMMRLQTLGNRPVLSTESLGIAPDWVEAMTFAWLARQTVNGKTGNLTSVTGASVPVVLGKITEFR